MAGGEVAGHALKMKIDGEQTDHVFTAEYSLEN